jgi:tRNA threonylcarbamoyladenosine biosynthesis protein TsaB
VTVVLGIDSATADAVVAVCDDGVVLREVSVAPEDGRPRHSELLLSEIERSVAAAGGWDHIERIAVGVGPGSFTGLRIGIATTRALAQARKLQLAPVSSLAALARGIAEHPIGAGRPALPVIDARRGQVFAALYDEEGEEIWEPAVLEPEELTERLAGRDSPSAAGDGTLRFAAQLEAAGVVVAPPNDAVHRIGGRHVCALGAKADEAPPAKVQPVYLRVPDAKRWIDRDQREPGA